MTADLFDYWWERGDWTVLITLRSVIWCVWRWDGGRAECVLWLVMITNYNIRTHGHTVRHFTYAFLQPPASPSSARRPVLLWDKIKYSRKWYFGEILIWAPVQGRAVVLNKTRYRICKKTCWNAIRYHVYCLLILLTMIRRNPPCTFCLEVSPMLDLLDIFNIFIIYQ